VFTYFIPISLMVLAGFTLGLVVGRLAWASARTASKPKSEEPKSEEPKSEEPKSEEPKSDVPEDDAVLEADVAPAAAIAVLEDEDPTQEPGSIISDAASTGSDEDLFIWRMKEVPAPEEEPASSSPDEINLDDPPADDPGTADESQDVVETAEGDDKPDLANRHLHTP